MDNEKNPDKMSERELRLEVKEHRAKGRELYFSEPATIQLTPQRLTISFHDKDGKEIAKLFENDDGELDFEGDTTGAAKIFMRDVVRLNSLAIREMIEELNERHPGGRP